MREYSCDTFGSYLILPSPSAISTWFMNDPWLKQIYFNVGGYLLEMSHNFFALSSHGFSMPVHFIFYLREVSTFVCFRQNNSWFAFSSFGFIKSFKDKFYLLRLSNLFITSLNLKFQLSLNFHVKNFRQHSSIWHHQKNWSYQIYWRLEGCL